MLVDISHVSAQAMRSALKVTKAPVIFSHSSAFSLCGNTRNVPDDVLLSLQRNGTPTLLHRLSSFMCDDFQAEW